MQEPQRWDERPRPALKEDQLPALIHEHLDIILTFAHNQRLFLWKDIIHEFFQRWVLLHNLGTNGPLLG